MKIKFICEATKKENKYIEPFIKFYVPQSFPKLKVVDIDCPDKNSHQTLPDYFIVQPKILVEIKEVHDRKDLEAWKMWDHNANRLDQELKSRRLQWLQGSYFVNTPPVFKVKRGREPKVIDDILNAVKFGQDNIVIDDLGKFKIVQFSDKGKHISFSITSTGGWIDSPGTIHKNIGAKIGIANKQLGLFKGNTIRKKILLLVNKYFWNDDPKQFIEALTYSYNDLLIYNDIDEIWLQVDTRDGQSLHTILYTHDFLTSLHQINIDVNKDTHIQLFERWFNSLSKLGDEHKGKLFNVLKKILKAKKPSELFYKNKGSKFVREEMVSLGIWLSEKERFNDAIWIINKFINDPDPEEPEKYRGDIQSNYHQQIINGEDPQIITSVLGHLAWVIQKLAVRKEHIIQALDYTKQLLTHNNFYVKMQAIVPLVEIAARRQWLAGYGKRPRQKKYREFHGLVFDVIKFLQKYPNCKAAAKMLSHVFAYYKDLSTKEAEKVLDVLKITDESSGLFVYFGIFRKRHYKEQPISFNAKRLEVKLVEIIKDSNEKYQGLRANIVWHFWKILDENRDEFNTLEPYIALFLEQPYQRDVFGDIERIISDWIEDKPDVCIKWYKSMLSKISESIRYKKQLQFQGGLWLMNTEEIVEAIASRSSDELVEITGILVSLWKKGVFIGSPKRIFESLRLIQSEKQRVGVKKTFRVWYKSMKKLNPELEKVEWS